MRILVFILFPALSSAALIKPEVKDNGDHPRSSDTVLNTNSLATDDGIVAEFRENVQIVFRVYVGQPVTLPCFVYGVNTGEIVVTWWKDGQQREISLGTKIWNPHYQLPRHSLDDWSLHIARVELADDGVYMCQINLQKVLEKPFYLHVNDKQEIPSNDQSSRYQYPLHQKTSKNPPIEDVQFVTTYDESILLSGDSEVYLHDAFLLSCEAYLPSSQTDTQLIWRLHNSTQHLSAHHSRMDVTMRWSYPDHKIYGVLTIRNVSQEDEGIWSCSAEPVPRPLVAYHQLVVKNKPDTQQGEASFLPQESNSLHVQSPNISATRWPLPTNIIFIMVLLCQCIFTQLSSLDVST